MQPHDALATARPNPGTEEPEPLSRLAALLRPTKAKRLIFFLAGDCLAVCLALIMAFEFRFEFQIAPNYLNILHYWLPIVPVIYVANLFLFRLYFITWGCVGLRELISAIKAVLCATAVLASLNLVIYYARPEMFMPRSVIIISAILALILIGSLRLAKRVYRELIRNELIGHRTLLVGAGPTGERLVREFLRSMGSEYQPVAFVDDDRTKVGTRIHGVPVAGTTMDLTRVARTYQVHTAILAITTAKHVQIKEWFDELKAAGVRSIKVVPHIAQLPGRPLSVKDLQDLRIEDLLSREPVRVDVSSVRQLIQGKTVLVSGGAGSIGSEIVRQALGYEPAQLVVMDIDESEIYDLAARLAHRVPAGTRLVPFVGDVRNAATLGRLFDLHPPGVVFHAAAYKHVPLMEQFPREALETNVLGTYRLARLARERGVEKFIYISTDKAVNPTSVMGASKRLGELVCSSLNLPGGTVFVSVRFGNVLGSRGSVVPLFIEQIRRGGPVTVTHPDIRRYFMSIPESVTLVFQAAAMGRAGEVLVLDMGQPLRILKLAEDLIRLNGMAPYTDIPIVFTGVRPGEKLFEELLTAEEGTTATTHEKIYVARNSSSASEDGVRRMLEELPALLDTDRPDIPAFLHRHVPYYGPPEPAAGDAPVNSR